MALSLDEMVTLESVTPEGAALLRDIARQQASFIVYSLPQNAGKSTLTEAILAEVSPGTPRHPFLGTEEEAADLLARKPDGYVVVAEVGHRGRPGYLAGDEVERLFDLAEHGYPVATSLHADDVDGVFEVLGRNGIPAERVAAVRFLVKIQPLGDPRDQATRRVVEHVDEVGAADGARPGLTRRYPAAGAGGSTGGGDSKAD